MIGIASILILTISTPLQLTPSDDSTVTSTAITWQAVEGAKDYRVIIDDEPTATGSYIRSIYKTTTNYTPDINPGTYYWKVEARDNNNQWSGWSPVWSFTLTEEEASPSPSPEPSPSPSPTPSPTPSPKPTKSTTKTTASPLPSPSPSPLPTPTPIGSKPAPKPTPSKINYKVPDLSGSVAGVSTPSSSTPTVNEVKTSPEKINKLPIIFGSAAILLIISSIALYLIKSNPSLINKFFKK